MATMTTNKLLTFALLVLTIFAITVAGAPTGDVSQVRSESVHSSAASKR